jgi:hypothetical protein
MDMSLDDYNDKRKARLPRCPTRSMHQLAQCSMQRSAPRLSWRYPYGRRQPRQRRSRARVSPAPMSYNGNAAVRMHRVTGVRQASRKPSRRRKGQGGRPRRRCSRPSDRALLLSLPVHGRARPMARGSKATQWGKPGRRGDSCIHPRARFFTRCLPLRALKSLCGSGFPRLRCGVLRQPHDQKLRRGFHPPECQETGWRLRASITFAGCASASPLPHPPVDVPSSMWPIGSRKREEAVRIQVSHVPWRRHPQGALPPPVPHPR